MEWNESQWLSQFVRAVTVAFPGRVVCIGLQGSRGRGEAGPDSDIDMVVVLDRLDPEDLERYRRAVEPLSEGARLCGFLSGRGELEGWEPGELFQFYHDTRPLVGGLEFLRERFTARDAARAVRAGACGIYHACVHNALYDRDPALLAGLYKSAAFTLQARYFSQTGWYVSRHRALLERLTGEDRAVLDRALALRAGEPVDMEGDAARLLRWAGALLRATGEGEDPGKNPSAGG